MSEPIPPEPDFPPPTQGSAGFIDELFGRKRVLAFGVVLAIVLGFFVLTIVFPADPGFRQTLTQQANSTMSTLSTSPPSLVFELFANNMRVALLESIPAFGFFFLPLSIYASGVIIQGLAVTANVSPAAVAVFYLFLPFTFVELSGYAVAFVSGTMLIFAWRRKRLHREAQVFVLELAAVAVILAVAAVMETISIVSPLAGILLWIPLAAAMVPIALRIRRSGI